MKDFRHGQGFEDSEPGSFQTVCQREWCASCKKDDRNHIPTIIRLHLLTFATCSPNLFPTWTPRQEEIRMAQIFVSHSAKHTKALDFLNKAFATTKVTAKYEEIEAIVTGKRTSQQIKADIQFSNAFFVVLGPHVEQIPHTRDWVGSESGQASGANKDVWVLEALEDSPKLTVLIPQLRHYVLFDYTERWLIYLRQRVASYDDSHVVPAMAVGAGVGGAIGEGVGAVIGGGIALFLALNAQQRPVGFPMSCPTCRAVYSV